MTDNGNWLRLAAALCLSGASLCAPAQIYKYQDEQGKWHFTDRPPPTLTDVEVVGQGARRSSAPVHSSVLEQLRTTFSPTTPVENASLAVVTVKTPAGSGSGFFVSDDGYLLTNRHVVRPETTNQWRRASEQLEQVEERFDEADSRLAEYRADLADMRRSLTEFQERIDGEPNSVRRAELEARHRQLQGQYRDRDRRYREARKDVDDKRRHLDKARSELSSRGAATTLSTNFVIALKDGTELRARLVQLSATADLALLKVDGYETPMLETASLDEVTQGMPVYALGSPLGMADYATAGVVTRVRQDHIVTDARILPGNSGGPLITPEGRAIGINTLKIAADALADGFGVAIPVRTARQEFPQVGWR